MKQINIAMVVNNLNIGGLEKIVIDLMTNLDTNVFNVFLICLDGEGSQFKRLDINQTHCLILKKCVRFNFSFFDKMRRFIKQNKIQILHVHNLGPLIFSGITVKILEKRERPTIVFTEHNQVLRLNTFQKFKFKNIYLNFADHIITCSKQLKNYYNNALGINKKIEVIHNGIDGKVFRKKSIKNINQNDKFVVGTAVVLSEQKGLQYLINAAVNVCTKTDDIIFLIAGDGPLKSQIAEQIKKNHISDKVFLLGYQENIPQLISTFDIYILPSLWEGLPLSLLEALCIGKPIIASDVGGVSEIVENQVNGLLTPPGDAKALALAILAFYNKNYNLKKMKDINQKKFDAYFVLDIMIKKYSDFYLEHVN